MIGNLQAFDKTWSQKCEYIVCSSIFKYLYVYKKGYIYIIYETFQVGNTKNVVIFGFQFYCVLKVIIFLICMSIIILNNNSKLF